ncbi:P-loop containing nucleoside triphosphate hydrolase protein [Clavulina sp. PMI_390]|nr:P-loop containing nucleoside triphosphate hydrolase protein [Clavulina sp. PMI_390]
MQVAIEKREIDREQMATVFAGAAFCNVVLRLTNWMKLENQLHQHIERYFGERVVRAKAFLDVPTSSDAPTLAKLSHFKEGGRTPWQLVNTLVNFGIIIVQLFSQVFVLLHLLRSQSDSGWLIVGSFVDPVLRFLRESYEISWASSQRSDAARRGTLTQMIEPRSGERYRQEIVSNGLAPYITDSYRLASKEGTQQTPEEAWSRYTNTSYRALALQLLQDAVAEGPRFFFAMKAITTPAHIPLSLATLEFVQGQARAFTGLVLGFVQSSGSLRTQVASIRELYELDKLPNLVKDGYKPLESNGRGVSVDVESVTFNYPGQDKPALRDVSFSLKPGDLCVIVGANGQGKSTLLKLLTRLYDASEGTIRIEGEPIQSYELAALRKATSILWQDFATFPVTMLENIRMGDPSTALLDFNQSQRSRVEKALELGGAEFIKALPKGWDSNYGKDPTAYETHGPDGYSILSTITKSQGKKSRNNDSLLSGGQSQRLALARTFMRPEDDCSLLIYDEPSAALDPQAEYDLFQRLKSLRGKKTMIFSTHRFGHLTKHADLILYMQDSTILESGTHDQLIAQQGAYAHLYNIQASAFI